MAAFALLVVAEAVVGLAIDTPSRSTGDLLWRQFVGFAVPTAIVTVVSTAAGSASERLAARPTG